jgi:hypothetical protein
VQESEKIRRNNLKMKALIWNSEGLRDTGKHLFIKETIREQNLDLVAFLETGRSNFATPFLRDLAGGRNFIWFCLPPHGRSGGILVGINSEVLSVRNVDAGEFCVKLHLRSKLDGFEWSFMAVYGAAQDVQKPPFLAELVRMCEKQTLPMLVGVISTLLDHPKRRIIIITMLAGLLFLMRLSKV